MAASIESYLKNLATQYYLKNSSDEVSKIDGSVSTLFRNLDSFFNQKQIKRKFVFGSYDRDTILPRRYDSGSDVDVMVVFNHSIFERTPETYRSWLQTFANYHYANRYNSKVTKTFPTVKVELNHIKYDLVPAREITTFYSPTLQIPDSSGGWIVTDPNDVKSKLVRANTTYSGIVRPIVRLLKAWNSKMTFPPFDSYDLESKIISFYYFGDNIQSGFFYAVKQLSLPIHAAAYKKKELENLQKVCLEVEELLQNNLIVLAKLELHKVLPY